MVSQHKDPNYYQQVQQNYDRLSGIYDLLSGKAELLILQKAIDRLKVRKINQMLDIGCGTGKALFEYGKAFQGGTLITGIDLSLKMCQKAHQQNRRVICSNGIALPFPKGIFNAITFNFSLEISPNTEIKQLLSECDRVLLPEGLICAVHMAVPSKRNIISDLYFWAHQNFPRVVDCRQISINQLLSEMEFKVFENSSHSLWGLPVQIILARKDH
jgi:ubiquinone/menaquinone biosynthesis C-methylase UbiE